MSRISEETPHHKGVRHVIASMLLHARCANKLRTVQAVPRNVPVAYELKAMSKPLPFLYHLNEPK